MATIILWQQVQHLQMPLQDQLHHLSWERLLLVMVRRMLILSGSTQLLLWVVVHNGSALQKPIQIGL